MDNEQTFRIVLILGLALMLPIGAFHRIKAHGTGEILDRSHEGLFILFTLRPIAAVGMIGILLYVINPSLMGWSSISLPTWLRWSGVMLGIFTSLLLVVTFRALGKNLTDTIVTREKHTLVTSGPYRWVRHPFYVSFLLAVVANSLVIANWFIAITGVIAFCLIVHRTPREEAKLVERFGEEYRRYSEHTGRFFPRRMSK